jgi:hypothetical protein
MRDVVIARTAAIRDLTMIAPVIALGGGLVSIGILGWVCLGVILGGSRLIWWATERAWGKFS